MKDMIIENIEDVFALDKAIEASSSIVVTAHTHPDGDAAGSTQALASYLSGRGKKVTVAYPEPLPDTIGFISKGAEGFYATSWKNDEEGCRLAVESADLIFCVDCNSFARTGGLEDVMRTSEARKVLIDHHLFPDRDAFDLVFSKADVSSACELLYWLLMAMPDIDGNVARLSLSSASALLAGMTTDTNNFANSVYPSTLEMSSSLLSAGVDRDAILSELYNEYRENRLRLMGYLLYENMRITPWGVAYMIVTGDMADRFAIQEGETEGFANMPLAIGKVKMSVFLKLDGDGFFRVSVRSKKGYSSNICASRYFHGGGHENASGGRLFFPQDIARPEDASGYICRVTEKLFKEEGYV